MKTTKILLGALRVSALVAVVLAFAASAQAQTVNVSFLPHYNYNGGDLQTDFSGLGAASDPGTVWNNVFPAYGATTFTTASSPYATPVGNTGPTKSAYGPITLLNSEGVATTVGFILTGAHYPIGTTGSTFENPLLQRWLDPNDFVAQSLEITGLTAGDKYNLFLYAQNGSANSGVVTFTFGGTPLTATNGAGDATGFVDNGNYVEFTNLIADGSGDISGTWQNISISTSGPNGFQIQEVVVPEPSTLATMSLAGLALLVLRKRFKKQSI